MMEPAHGNTVATYVHNVKTTLEKTVGSELSSVFRTFVQMVEPAHGITIATLVNAVHLTIEKRMEP